MPARQLRSLRLASFLAGFGLIVVYAGCSSSGSSTTSVTHPTMIEVSPEDFLGNVPCTDGPGLKRYVATLIDTDYSAGGASSVNATDENAGGAPSPFTLPSSLPTPCLAAVGFGLVVAGHHYDVEIDGYDTDDIAPRGLGSRQMVSPAPSKAEPVTPLATPRWTARCEDAIAVTTTIVRAQRCTKFTPADAAAPGSVHLALGSLLGGLRCGEELGEVDHFEVSLAVGDAAPQVETFPCTTDAEAIFEALAPRQQVSAYVTAFSAGMTDAFAGANCNAFTLPEASVDADCSKLSQVGTLRVDLPAAYALLGLECSKTSLASAVINVPGEDQARRIQWPDCLHPFEHGFAPGAAGLSITVRNADGSDGTGATCGATVIPGQLVVAECSKNP
jgi:hypothetical protein